MARCRYCGTSNLIWTNASGSWILYYQDAEGQPNTGARHRCRLAREYYVALRASDNVVMGHIQQYLACNPNGTTDDLIINSIISGTWLAAAPVAMPMPAPPEELQRGIVIAELPTGTATSDLPSLSYTLGAPVMSVGNVRAAERIQFASPAEFINAVTPRPYPDPEIRWLGAFEPRTSYLTNDIVIHNSVLYRALRSTRGEPPRQNPMVWGNISQANEARLLAIFSGGRNASHTTPDPQPEQRRSIKL